MVRVNINHTIPYHDLLQGDHVEMVKLLAQHGGSYGVTNKYSLTPMDIAHKLDRAEILKLYQGFVQS